MPKFMGIHSFPAGAISREQLDQLATAAQNDPLIRGYRSFVNLSEGKAICVMEGPSAEAVSAWFRRMQMPCDSLVPVELEGDRGNINAA